MLLKIKYNILNFLHRLTYLSLKVRGWILAKNKYNEMVGIFADYLDVSFLLSAPSLGSENIVLFATKRYPFFQLIKKGLFNRIKAVVVVENYSEAEYVYLLVKCQKHRVKVVMIQAGDFMVPAYNYINKALGWKANDELAIQCSLDKGIMRDRLNESQISVFKTVHINSPGDLEKVNFFPCVLKPKIGTFSEGVILIHQKEDLRMVLEDAEKQRRKTEFSTGYIVEEYIEGRQFDVEGIIHNGKLVILSIVEENYTGFFPYFNINWFFFNAFVGNQMYQRIYDAVQDAFVACNMLHGAYHCELRINDKGEVCILEFSNRMGGGFEEPISHTTGNHFAEVYVKSMLDKLTSIDFNNANKYLLQKYFKERNELDSWRDFLERNHIKYQFKLLNYREHIGMMNIYHDDRQVMMLLAENFSLGYKEPLI